VVVQTSYSSTLHNLLPSANREILDLLVQEVTNKRLDNKTMACIGYEKVGEGEANRILG
jgi:hypothetical protein